MVSGINCDDVQFLMEKKSMNRIIECRLDSTYKEIYTGIWQHDYGQILRITGADLPKAVEVQFSLEDNGGDTLTRIGTTVDGVTEVKVPDSLLKNENCTQNYLIYAWIYITDDASGNTEYQIILHVKSRPKPEKPTEEPLPEPNIFHETVEAVNAAADRAEQAEQNAKASAIETGKYAASASKSAVAALKTKEDALKEVGEKKQKVIEAIQEQEETSVGKITTHTDDEIQRIQKQTVILRQGLSRPLKMLVFPRKNWTSLFRLQEILKRRWISPRSWQELQRQSWIHPHRKLVKPRQLWTDPRGLPVKCRRL